MDGRKLCLVSRFHNVYRQVFVLGYQYIFKIENLDPSIIGFNMNVIPCYQFIQLINVGNGVRVSSQIFTLRIVDYIA